MSRPVKNPFDQFMQEGDKFSAPFKLVLRLIRSQCRRTSALTAIQTVETRKATSLVRKVFGWDGISVGVLATLALGFLALPHQYDKARWCFVAAAIALIIKITHSVEVEQIYPKLLIAVLGAITAGLLVSQINNWVTGLELDAIAAESPSVRVITTEKYISPPPSPPPRSYLVFDGPPLRFPDKQDDSGATLSRALRIGDELAFNYYLKNTGPSPIEIGDAAKWLYVISDVGSKTQQQIIEDFKANVTKEKGEHRVRETWRTCMPGMCGFDTVYAITEDRKRTRLLTGQDLESLRDGTKFALAIVDISYKDKGKVHHLRTCGFLQPPAIPPGIWHFCEGFGRSD